LSQDNFDVNHLPDPPKNGGIMQKLGQVGMIRTLSSVLGRASFANRAGMTFGGKRDLYEALGYPRKLEPRDYRARYERGDIGARIVEAFPNPTWRAGAEVLENDDLEIETAFETEWQALAERLKVWSVFRRADILAGLGRYSVILIGAEGRLEEELPKMTSQEGVLFLSVFAEEDAEINTFVNNPEDPRFGLPDTYTLQRNTQGQNQPAFSKQAVHWSRVLHVAEGTLDDTVFGTPRLKRVWNRLDDLDKVVGGGSEAFWARVHQGYHMNLDSKLDIDPDDKEKLEMQFEEFTNGMRRALATKGMDMTVFGSDVSNFGNQVTSLMSIVAGATSIPQRLLMGSERGELASTQDKSAWDERVQDRRDAFAAPCVVEPFVDRLIDNGALPQPSEFFVKWPEIEDLDENQKADIAVKWAGLNTTAKKTIVLPC